MLRRSKLKILNDLEQAIDSRGEKISYKDNGMEDAIDKVLSEDFAFVAEDSLDRFQGEQRCLLYKVGEPLIKVHQAIGLQKSKEEDKYYML